MHLKWSMVNSKLLKQMVLLEERPTSVGWLPLATKESFNE
jgi:hypothetical protein